MDQTNIRTPARHSPVESSVDIDGIDEWLETPARPDIGNVSVEGAAATRGHLWRDGFRPVAVYNADADHASPGKAPAGDDWQNRARRDPPEAATDEPQPWATNTGILCDGLRAVDIDVDDPVLVAQIKNVVETYDACVVGVPVRGRGGSPRVLMLFRAAEGEPPKRVITGSKGKIEILGRGQQFVAFGRHPDGGAYVWEGAGPGTLDILPVLTEDGVTALLTMCAPLIGAPSPGDADTGEHMPSEPQADPLRIAAALNHIPNDGPADWEAWNKVGMAIWRATGGSDAGWEAFDAWSARNAAYYDPGKTRERWDHYFTSPPTQIGAGTIFHMAAKHGYREPGRDRPADERAAKAEPAEPIAIPLTIGTDVEIAGRFLADLSAECGSEVVHAEGGFYRYDGTRWAVLADDDLRRRVHRYDGRRYGDKGLVRLTQSRINSILGEAAAIAERGGFFNNPPVGINCANGFIRFTPDGLPRIEPHSPEHRQRHMLAGEWDREMDWTWEAPLLYRLLDGCFTGDPDAEDKIKLLGEALGAAALGIATRLTAPKAIVLHGMGAENGKSRFLGLARGLLPASATRNVPPTDFANDRRRVLLAGALLNTADELGTANAIGSDAFKGIVTGEPVSGAHVYQRPVTFRPTALHLFATNTLPSFANGFDRGVQRRLLVVPFNRTIPENERVPDLDAKIVAQEPTGLLAFAVEGASRLIRNGRFTEPVSSREALQEWLHGADPVIGWLAECVEIDPAARCEKASAYQHFQRWAAGEGFDSARLPRINNFVQRVRAQDHRIKEGGRPRGADGKQHRMFLGVRLRQ